MNVQLKELFHNECYGKFIRIKKFTCFTGGIKSPTL